MRTPIQDEFSHLPVSRQRKWQLRQQARGNCTICGQPAVTNFRCLKHFVYDRELAAKYKGCQRKHSCRSRRLEVLADRHQQTQPK